MIVCCFVIYISLIFSFIICIFLGGKIFVGGSHSHRVEKKGRLERNPILTIILLYIFCNNHKILLCYVTSSSQTTYSVHGGKSFRCGSWNICCIPKIILKLKCLVVDTFCFVGLDLKHDLISCLPSNYFWSHHVWILCWIVRNWPVHAWAPPSTESVITESISSFISNLF